MVTNIASTDSVTITNKLRVPLSASGFGNGIHVIWRSGFMFVSKDDDRISSEYEVSEKEFGQMAHMVDYFVQRAYEQGQVDKAKEIRQALNLNEDA